jgi:tetratricopeptide (TPR) repeat protein
MTHLIRRSRLLFSLFGAVLLLSNVTFADSASEAQRAAAVELAEQQLDQARTHAIAGFEALDSGRYAQAVTAFTQALALLDVPTVRMGRGDALVKLNQWHDALGDYQAASAYVVQPGDSTALREAPAQASAKYEALKARMPRLRVETSAPEVRVSIDEGPPQVLSNGAWLTLDPGGHSVRVESGSDARTAEVIATPEREHVVPGPESTAAEAPSATAEQVSLAAEPGAGVRDDVIVAGAITGVLAAGFAVTGLLFLTGKATYDDAQADPASSESRRERLHDTAKALQWVNTAALAGAVVGAGVTTYLWLAPSRSDTPSAASGGPQRFASPDGVVLGIGGRF